MTKKRRKILDADIKFISLCPKGKNYMSVLYKEDDGTVELTTLIKDDQLADLGQLTAVVYAPGMPDAEGDFAEASAVAKMCHSFMRNGAQIDVRHNKTALQKEQIYVTECFIAKENDPEFAGITDKLNRPVNIGGAWITRFQIDDEELRKEYRDGKWDGVSMFGNAKVEAVSKGIDPTTEILDALASRLGVNTLITDDQEIDMKPEELQKTLTDNNAALAKSIVDGIKEVLKPEAKEEVKKEVETPVEKAIEFVGSRSNPKDVQTHLAKVKDFELQKSVDWNNPESIEEYYSKIEKSDDSGDDSAHDGETELQKELRTLKARIAKEEGKSTQQGGSGDTTTMSKEDRELEESIDRIAASANGTYDPYK